METWVPVSGFEGEYEVSDQGRVRSLARLDRRGYLQSGRLLKPMRNNRHSNHRRVVLSKDGKRTDKLVHRLVLETFIGPCPEGHEACHNDGNPSNNVLSNLRWGTKKSNALDREEHRQEPHVTVRYTDQDRREALDLLQQGLTYFQIRQRLGMSPKTLWLLKKGQANR